MRRSHKAILLIFFLISPLLVTYVWIIGEKYFLRKKIKNQIIQTIEKDKLVRLSFSIDESISINWKEKDEFEFKGEMYDVVYTLQSSDSVSFWCWWDNAETELNKKLNELLKRAMGNDQESKDKIASFFSLLFYEEIDSWNPGILKNHHSNNTSYFFSVKTNIVYPPTPPPLI